MKVIFNPQTGQIEYEPTSSASAGVSSISKNGSAQLTGNVTLSEGSGIALTQTGQDISIAATGGGTGDVVGPAVAVDGNFASFDTTTGKKIKDSGKKAADFQGALTLTTVGSSGASTLVGDTLNIPQYTAGGGGDVIAPATNTADYIPQWNGANSKTLKDGLAVPAGGLAGLTALGGKEDLSNKATNFGTINDTLYPTVKAVNDAINTAVTGLLDYRGTYDASTNLFPASGGSGLIGAVLKGDFWVCSVAGTLGGTSVTPGDLIIALVDTPAQVASNWDLVEHDLGYAPENVANKVTSISGASTDVQYPSAKLVYDQLATKLGTTLNNGNIFVGNSSNVATGVAVSGDASLSNTGVLGVNKTRLNVRNETGSTIVSTKAVYVSGFNNLPLITLGDNTNDLKYNIIGLTIAPITDQTNGFIATSGQCDAETNTFNVGDELYLSTTGTLINTPPTSGVVTHIGIVTVKENYPTGKILIYRQDESSIKATASAVDMVIRMGDSIGAKKTSFRDYDNTEVASIDSDGNSVFTKVNGNTLTTGTGTITITGTKTLTVSDTSSVSGTNTGDNAANTTSNTYADGKIAKTTNITSLNDTGVADGEIAVFNLTNKDIRTSDKTIVTTLGATDATIPTSKAIQDMGYTTNVGTVTSVAAITLGTTGTDLSSTVATGTTTPFITLQVPTASATNRGALSAADWATFNGKQPALNGTGFVKASGTTISYDNNTYLTSVTAHNILSTTHGDTLADTVVRGDVMIGNATPKWSRLAFPATPTGKVLQATATDVSWSTSPLGTMAYTATGDYALVGQTFYIGTTQVAINRASAALTLAGLTLTTPDIGAATATTINKVTITAPTTAATLTLVTGSSLITAGAFALTLTSGQSTNVTIPTVASLTMARIDAAQTFTGVQTMTSPAITTSITTGSTSFTAWAGATTLLTIGGTGASASMFAPSTLDASSSTTGAIRTSGGISAAKSLNVGTTITSGSTISAVTGYKINGAAATAGKILVGDGTNFVASTPTFPNASATSGKIIKSDGTNWLASTETYAAPGTTGNVLRSDGTNWTASASAAKADILTTARTIGGTSFNGSANIAIGALNSTNVGATTSAELAGVISDETGTGLLVFNDSPTITGFETFQGNLGAPTTPASGYGVLYNVGSTTTHLHFMNSSAVDETILTNKTGITNAMLSTTAGEIGGTWKDYTPTGTNFNTAQATLNYAKYTVSGKNVRFKVSYTLTAAAVGTEPTFSLPVTAASATAYSPIGTSMLQDTTTNTYYGPCVIKDASNCVVAVFNASGTYQTYTTISATVPHTWANTDIMLFEGSYEAA